MARFSWLTPVALLLALPLHAAITGRVLDEDGKPLRGARVRVRALETSEQAYARILSKDPLPQWLATAETNDSGIFRVDTKSNAVVELMADAAGRQFHGQDLADGDDTTIVLRKGTARRGRITADGKPVAGAIVVIGRSHVTRSDAEGNFESPDPGEGTNRIQVIHPDYAIVDRPLRDKPRAEMSFDVALKSGTVIRGRVVDSAGRGVAGAVVRSNSWPLAQSGEDGSFEIAHAQAEKPALYAREGNRVGSLLIERAKPPYVIQLRPAATVSGTVRNNKDESPVPGTRLMIRAEFGDSWSPSAIADAKGNFVIDGLEPGTRRFFVGHPAFFGGGNSEMRLDEGARLSRIVYVTPLARLAGKVIDEENKPVAAARIVLVNTSGGAVSAPDGTFSLRFPSFDRPFSVTVHKTAYAPGSFGPYSVEPGETKSGLQFRLSRGSKLEIRLIDRDGVPFPREPVNVSRRTDARFARITLPCGSNETSECRSDEEGRVTVNITEGVYDIMAGGETTVRRDLPNQTLNARSSPLTIELERGAVVEGRVVWSDGTPLNVPATVMTTTNPPATAPVTDGSFAMRNVPAGKITLVAEGAPPSFVKSEPVDVHAPASGITIKVPRYGRIEGRVVERDTEKAVRDFAVLLQQGGTRGRPSPPKTFRADDGRFAIEDVTPGVYELRVQATGFTRANSTSVTVEESKTASAAITLDRGGVVVGRVTAEGRPVAEVVIGMSSGDSRAVLPSVVTDANGEFTLDGVPAGTQRFHARRQGYAQKYVTATVTPPKETRLDIELMRGREIRGRVIDTNGQPVAQVEIMTRVTGPDVPGVMTMSDSDGAFKVAGLGDRPVTLVTRKEGFTEATAEVNPATSSDVTITISRGGTITGRILGVAPADLPFVDVRASRSGGRAQPDAGGNFTLTGIPDGEVMVFASLSRPRIRSVQQRVTVTNGIAPPVDLDFSGGIAVRGRVTQQGQLVEGHIMFSQVPRGSNPNFAQGEIARDGMYEVRVAQPGEYEVRVNRYGTGGMLNAGRVTVAGEMVHDIELRGAKVSGIVVDATTRQPIVGAGVLLVPGNEVQTNGAGRFTFDLVGDGQYRIRAQADGYASTGTAFDVTNGSAPEIELALSRGLAVQFRVVDAATGQLVDITGANATDASKVAVYYGNPEPDATGMRRILLQPGTYELRVFAPGYVPKPFTLTVPGPPLDVRIQRAATKP